MTMDLYGHPIDDNLWTAAGRLGARRGHSSRPCGSYARVVLVTRGCDLRERVEPPVGIEPTTFSSHERSQERPRSDCGGGSCVNPFVRVRGLRLAGCSTCA
jgi:hypothetical protein